MLAMLRRRRRRPAGHRHAVLASVRETRSPAALTWRGSFAAVLRCCVIIRSTWRRSWSCRRSASSSTAATMVGQAGARADGPSGEQDFPLGAGWEGDARVRLLREDHAGVRQRAFHHALEGTHFPARLLGDLIGDRPPECDVHMHAFSLLATRRVCIGTPAHAMVDNDGPATGLARALRGGRSSPGRATVAAADAGVSMTARFSVCARPGPSS